MHAWSGWGNPNFIIPILWNYFEQLCSYVLECTFNIFMAIFSPFLCVNRDNFMTIFSLYLCVNPDIFGWFAFNFPSSWETIPFYWVIFLFTFRSFSPQLARSWISSNSSPDLQKTGKLFPRILGEFLKMFTPGRRGISFGYMQVRVSFIYLIHLLKEE